MVHEPALAATAVAQLRADPPTTPLLVLEGHTHKSSLEHDGTLTVLNAGTVGGGGTGNLASTVGGNIGLARVTYAIRPAFAPAAADMVEIDPGDGGAQAKRVRLDLAAGPSR